MVTFKAVQGVFGRPLMSYSVNGMEFSDTVPAEARYVRHNEHGVILYDDNMQSVFKYRHQQYDVAGKTRHYFDTVMGKDDIALVETAPVEIVTIRI